MWLGETSTENEDEDEDEDKDENKDEDEDEDDDEDEHDDVDEDKNDDEDEVVQRASSSPELGSQQLSRNKTATFININTYIYILHVCSSAARRP